MEVGRSSEGTAELRGSDLDPARAEAVYGRLTHLAKKLHREGDPRTVDQLRADLLLDLLLGEQSRGGAEPTGSVDIRVDLETLAELKEMPGDLAGYGPVIADIARQVTDQQRDSRWTWTVTDSVTGLPLHQGTTRRRPGTGVRRMVAAYDPRCVFPGCRTPAQNCDLDHRDEYRRGGPTCEGNLAPLCRHHHMIRHRVGWKYEPSHHGDYLWISPLGRRYTTSGQPP